VGASAGCNRLADEIPLEYNRLFALADVGQQAVSWGTGLFWPLLLSALFFLLPGGVLVVWLVREDSWIERVIVATGLSVAVYALLVYATLAGLQLSLPVLVGVLVACGLGILARLVLDWRRGRLRVPSLGRVWRHLIQDPAPLALLAIFVLVLGVRLFAVRHLVAPMWGDSYQHTMIAQLIADHGGLFDSWEPYAQLPTFTYHFGLHANVALYHWLSHFAGSEESMVQSVIWIGQVLNALAALALYPLAAKVSCGPRNRWAGVGTVLIAGLLMPMPMYYVNWGRYTQLAGQVILPAAVYLTWSLFEAPAGTRSRWWPRWGGWLITSWIAVVGLAVTHYRVLIIYFVFVFAWVLLSLRRATWRSTLLRVALLGLGVCVLFMPWFLRTFGGKIMVYFGAQLSTVPAKLPASEVQHNAIGNLATYMAPLAWLLLPVAVAVGLWRRQRGVLVVSLWWFLVFVITNPHWFGLPGSGAITNFAVFIAAYIPAGILLGWLFGWLVNRLNPHTGVRILLVLLVVGIGLWGARVRREDVRMPQHALVLPSDLSAMAWIRENTPQDARFLTNSFFAYGGTAIVGSDGGWWLPLLAGRANTVPPLNYALEQGPWPGYRLWVNDLTRQIQERGVDDPETVDELRAREITHVYIGQRQGRVNYAGPHVLSPEELLQSSYYRPVYHQDQVWVFELEEK
jgi:hypothetical protein